MQAIILAAGMGKRLKNKTKNHTKSMVEILGKTFLEHSLDKLSKFNLSKIIIVIGYCGNEIVDLIGNSYNGIPVVYIENKDYATTNNIYSLYLTKEYLEKEDTILLESDIIYDAEIIENLINNPMPNLAVVDKYKPYMDGTVVKINNEDEIIAFVPKEHFDYNEVDKYYKTVNIYKFSKEFLNTTYIPFLGAYCTAMGNNSYYEQVLRVVLSLEQRDLKVLKINNEKWYEVDDLQDYDIAETIFCDDIDLKLKKYHSRFGGYWRFCGLKDFCYLVNPYFPNKSMIEELKYSFTDLLTNYPSGQSVEKLLVGNIWGIKEDNVLVGNGAAELISALIQEIKGNVGIILPTFQEYPARLKEHATVHYFTPNNPDFSYTLQDLKNFANKVDTLILINPDNPSGNFIPKTQILDLTQYLKNNNKRLILDESFVDFSTETENNSLLNNEIIENNENLIIIKSISKSYGVPGIRLGIMATSDKNILEKCYKNISVWNINSYGEYFLQILNKHKKHYNSACKKIVENRDEFFTKLSKLPFLRPIKSQANYILCEVLKPYASDELCKILLKSNILIKDCQNKLGFNGKQYIRIAVKSKEDNNELINILESLV